MPEYTQVQTYVACDQHTFAEVIPSFRQVLEAVQCTSPEVLDWLSHLDWPSWEEGFSMEYPTLLLPSQAAVFPACPYLLFPLAEGEERWADWVELGILFEAEPLREAGFPFGPPGTPIVPYRVHAGNFIWRILEAFAVVFLENGVYFTDELQGGRVGSVVMEEKGNFWLSSTSYPQFEAAIIPIELAERFQPVPELFEQIRPPGAVGVAVHDRFLALSWKASVQRFTVVDNLDFCPSGLTVPSGSPYYQKAHHDSYFKRRGSLWFSCFCSWSCFSSLSRCLVAFFGLICSVPMHKQGADALWSTVCSNLAPRLIALSVASVPPTKDPPLHQYAPGVR